MLVGMNFHIALFRLSAFAWLVAIVAAVRALCPFDCHAAEHVIHISLDGLNATYLQQIINAGNAPNLKRLQKEGAWTSNARADHAHTNTLPNHTCMLTGRPVLSPKGMPQMACHGWTTNKAPKLTGRLHDMRNPCIGYVASVFDVVHDAGLSTALYATKDKFILYDQSYDETNGRQNARGRDKIDVYFFADDGPPRFSATMQARFLADMAARHFNYAFVHYRDTDSTGHALGWGSSAWLYALRNLDRYVGEVIKLVETDAALAGKTAIILTTDHGGSGFGHDDIVVPEHYTIPILVWGAGVGRGDLYAMNRDTRVDPGKSRVDCDSASQPIRNGDTGNLALSLLGLGPIPGSVINAKQDLRVALVGDYNLDGAADAADDVLWRKTEGSTTDLRADGNRDGRVDQADHDLWRAHFGQSAAAQ